MKDAGKTKKDPALVRDIVVYNRYLDALGGGEFSTILLASALTEVFPNAKVRIVTFDADVYPYGRSKVESKGDLEAAFGFALKGDISIERVKTGLEAAIERTRGLPRKARLPLLGLHVFKLRRKLKEISRGADIFFNHTFLDEFRPASAVNVYFCMFPQAPRRSGFLKAYDRVIGISEFTRRHIRKRWGRDSSLVYPFVLSEAPKYRPYAGRENIILNIGRFFREGHNKRQDIVIKAFKAIKDRHGAEGWRLVLIGRYAEKDRSVVEELKRESSGYEVVFLTDLSDAEKKAYLDRAKVYVHATGFGTSEEEFPERMEHFGITVVEAKTHGLVPVVIDRGAMGELVTDGSDGFRFSTLEGLVEKLDECINGDLEGLSRNAYRSSIEKFSPAAYREALMRSLEDFFDWGAEKG